MVQLLKVAIYYSTSNNTYYILIIKYLVLVLFTIHNYISNITWQHLYLGY
jgi:hypothetical protein